MAMRQEYDSRDETDEYELEEVPVEAEDDENDEEEEDFESAMRNLKVKTLASHARDPTYPTEELTEGTILRRPEVIDDFFRNFLIKVGLHRTLEAFQTEWYELSQRGALKAEDVFPVPDIYQKNQQLDDMVKTLRNDLEKARDVASKARGTWDKLKKERDFHRMHHKRVVQEKNRLIEDLKRLKKHLSTYEPTLNELRHKYEVAMKEKMLMRLERDKLFVKVEGLEATMKQLDALKAGGAAPGELSDTEKKTKRKPLDSSLPPDDHVNPFRNLNFEPASVDRMNLSKVFKGHAMTISCMALHPKKAIVATASDDTTWKMWALPTGELIMSGDGHKDWVAGCDFHPKGTHLVTGSGDGTVKLWDFAHSICATTFTDHTQAVWAVAFHHCGDFVVSASMDHTIKLWDINSQRCRQTLRGHVDSVNAVVFQPFSNQICTASGDKTVSLWDTRTGLCTQTFYGHKNACNNATFDLKGETIASTDADGVVKIWDMRMVNERCQLNAGPHAANKCAFDRSGQILAVASDDASVKLYNVSENKLVHELRGHDDAVQCVLFDPFGKYVLTGGADFRMYT